MDKSRIRIDTLMSLAIGLTCAVMIAGMVIGSMIYFLVETIKEYTMAKTARKKRDGTGPFSPRKVGARKAAGVKCPKKK